MKRRTLLTILLTTSCLCVSAGIAPVRYGLKSDRSVGLVDDLTLSYEGNRLTAVHDAADRVTLEGSLDFDGSSSYTSGLNDSNILLQNYIIRARKEIIQNQNK